MSSGMKAWDDFLKQLGSELGTATVDKWLRPLKIQRFDACNLYLESPDSFKAVWFEEHIRHRANEKLINNNNKKIRVHLTVRATPSEKDDLGVKKNAKISTQGFSLDFDPLSAEFTFENFITDASANLLGYKLLLEASETFPPPFNPIYVFGRTGTGKTHLLMAAAAALKAQGKKALYVRGESFTEHVVKAIRGGEMQAFRKMYRNIDALFLDNIEIFARKSATQEEFFHTFNTLHVEGKLIVLSAQCAPSELQHIEPRLTSRFEWGIVIPLLALDPHKLEEILQQRVKKLNLPLQTNVIPFLLEKFPKNLPALIRALEALVLRTHLNQGVSKKGGAPLSIEDVKHALGDLIAEEEKTLLTPAKIIRAVADYYGIRMDDILSKSQSRECAVPRQIAMHLCRQELNLPFMKIGDLFSRDHSTVMASVKQIQKGVDAKNQDIVSPVKGILQLLGNATV